MPSKLILDPSEPGMKDVLTGLKVGQKVTFDDVEITVERNDANVFEAGVTSISVETETETETDTEVETPKPDEIPPASNSSNPGKFDMGAGG